MNTVIVVSFGIVLAALLILLVVALKKGRKTNAIVIVCICIIVIATYSFLSLWVDPLKYSDGTKESYIALQNDKNLATYRIIKDGVIVMKYPEWNDEAPPVYRVDYASGNIIIHTRLLIHDEEEYNDLQNNENYTNYNVLLSGEDYINEYPKGNPEKEFMFSIDKGSHNIILYIE